MHHNIENEGSWLFDLSKDPGEQHDIATHEPARTEEMEQLLMTHLKESLDGGTLDAITAEMPEELLERLRALGYAD